MAQQTGISWTNRTWNPFVGCSKISPGCENCYAIRMANRLSKIGTTRKIYEGTVRKMANGQPNWTGVVRLNESALEKPLHWREPSMIFVNSMSDLLHESIPFESIRRVFDVIERCPQHMFQILTKREDGMKEFAEWYGKVLPNVWLGVSVEDQERANQRVPVLLQTPAAVRFVSMEPLLGAIDLEASCEGCLSGVAAEITIDRNGNPDGAEPMQVPYLDWVIVGGESGPNARECHIEWIERIVHDCQETGVPVFVKQLGASVWQDGERVRLNNSHGADMSEWPEHLRVREFPKTKE